METIMEQTFTDLDLDKLGELTNEPAAPQVPATTPEATPAQAAESSKETPAQPEAKVDVPPVATDVPAKPADWAPEADDEVQKIIKELETAATTTDDTAKELTDKAKASWDKEVVDLVEELTQSVTRERILRQAAEKESSTYKEEYGKTLDEKNALDLENKQKSRLYGIIDSDELLQSIVAYSYKAKDDPSYKDKLITAAKELLRREGEDVDAVQKRAVNAEKAAMGDVPNSVPMWGKVTPTAETQDVTDMFETL